MAKNYQTSLDRSMMPNTIDERPDKSFPDKARSCTKRSFHDRSETPQASVSHDQNLSTEDGSILSYRSGSRTSHVLGVGEDMGRFLEGASSEEFHIEKRPRISDWPLRSINTNAETPSVPRGALHDQYDALNFAPIPADLSMKPRLSKFVEGSMKDRASQKPHQSYIDDSEQPEDRFEAKQNNHTQVNSRLNGPMYHTNRSVTLSAANDKPEASQPSSIFRFGKSVAAAFNPSSWRIWSKQQEEETQERQILRDHHEKAEKIYKELKATGQFGSAFHESHLDATDKAITVNKHDSGVDIEHCSSIIDTADRIGSRPMEIRSEEKRYGRVFLEPPEGITPSCSGSPTPELAAPLRNSSSQNREPTLRKGDTLDHPQALRRLPSRKDLQKQQKLVKRVSDLEGKLEAARRQLAEAIGEPVPTQASCISKSRFTPGTLVSLPSESLLGVKASEYSLGDAEPTIGVENTILNRNRVSSPVPSHRESNMRETRYDYQKLNLQIDGDKQVGKAILDAHEITAGTLVPIKRPIQKIKGILISVGDDKGRCQSTPETDGNGNFETVRPSVQKRGPGRPRKINNLDLRTNSHGAEPTEYRYAASEAIIEANNPRMSHGSITKPPKNRRVVVSKQAASSSSNSRIPRKDSSSKPSSSIIFNTDSIYPRQGEGTGKTTKHDRENEEDLGIALSSDIPPVPELPNSDELQKAKPDSNQSRELGRDIAMYNMVDSHKKGSQITLMAGKKDGTKSEQAFEWPADVF